VILATVTITGVHHIQLAMPPGGDEGASWVARCRSGSAQTAPGGSWSRDVNDDSLPGFERFYVSDPFGNRIEFLEHVARI
jgi:hypothetical protein